MDRRSFLETCSAGAACVPLGALAAAASEGRPRSYARVLLVDANGDPLKASALRPRVNYVFHYPFQATPVFLLHLGKPAVPQAVSPRNRLSGYEWPGGVGPGHAVVAYSAICSHKLVYPTRDVSFISFRPDRARRGVQNELIHCCADHSQFDPAQGGLVLSGPAPQPLAAVLLSHDPAQDTLTAYGTVGAELFDEFFEKYRAKLSLEVGPKANLLVEGRTVVQELTKFCRNTVQC